jgi:hypothetical protein
MKPRIKSILLAAIFTMSASAIVVAQPTNSRFEEWYRAKYGHPSPTEEARLNSAKQIANKPAGVVPDDLAAPTNDQRVAIAKCMKATDQVSFVASQMQAIGRPWGRGRLGYAKNDLFALADYREQLRPVLTNLAAVHQEFLNGLSETQKQNLDRSLKKLDHLQAELSSRTSDIDHDLMRAEPGPDSTGISWDVNKLKTATEKWRSEHRKIEKELGFDPDQSSIDQSSRSAQYGLSYARHTSKE